MTPDDLRRDATLAVVTWIEESLGREVAHEWIWVCTPYPAGLPSDEQLAQGLAIAVGELSYEAARKRVHEEMDDAHEAYKAERRRQAEGSPLTAGSP